MKVKKNLPKIDYWTKEELFDLSKQLNRRHEDHLKAQFLRTKAYEMIRDDDIEVQKKGVSLMKLMIALFPNIYIDIMAGHSLLGKYYRSIFKYDNALFHFGKIMDFNNSNVSNHKFGRPEMEIALTIIVSNRVENYDYAKQVMSFVDPRTLFVEGEKKQYRYIMEELSK